MSSIIQDKEAVEELIKAFVAFAPKEWKLNEDNLVYNIDSSRDGNSAMSFNGLNFKVNEDLQAKGAYNQAKVKAGGHPTAIYLILNSDINKAGVGDGLKPDVARTYVISFEIQGKRYRQRSNLPSHLYKIYVYSRTIEGVIQQFSDKLAPILDYIQIQGIEIDGADKNDWDEFAQGGAVKEYKFGDKFKIDTDRVDQYEGTRIVDTVEVEADAGKHDKQVLVYIPSLLASHFVYKADLKPIEKENLFSNEDIFISGEETEKGGTVYGGWVGSKDNADVIIPFSYDNKADAVKRGEEIVATLNSGSYKSGIPVFGNGGTIKQPVAKDTFLYASTGVKVKVLDYDSRFGGRVLVKRADGYETGGRPMWQPLKKFSESPNKNTPEMKNGGNLIDIDSLHPLDLWVKLIDNRYYRKFQFPKSDMVSGKYREIVDNGVSERMEDNGDYWDVTISVASESEADRISAIFVKEFPVGMKMEEGGSIKSDFVKINHRGKNLTAETLEYEKGNPNKNGNLKLTLTPEGREVLVEASSEGKLDAEIMWELFESIQVNSELMYFDDAGEVGLGMTSAPAITDGYYYDDDGKLTDKGHPDAQVFWYPNYMVRSFMDDFLENGYAIFVRADSYEKGGTVGNATLWKVGNGSAVKLISGTKRQIKTFLTKNRFKGMAYENHQGEYSLQEWDSEVTEEQVLKHNKSNQLSATSQEYGRGGKVSGFNLTYEAWGEDSTVDKNGKLLVGTIRTIPENYYVATVYSDGIVSNDGIEANTRHISSSEIQEWYSENVPKLNKAELLAAINKRLARQYEGSVLQAQLSNISEKLSKGIFENGGALAGNKSFFWWW